MKEFEVLFKSVAEGLKAMAEGIHAIAKKVDEIAKGQAPEKPTKSKPGAKKRPRATVKKGARKPKVPGKRPLPASEKVLKVIKGSKAGVDTATISTETGLDKKQVSNVLFRLKKAGKVKSVERGVYTAI